MKFFERLKERLDLILRILLFVASIILISWLLPRERKFSVDFQKGRPWMHEDLFADFDFPIHKTEDQLQAEKDTILKEFKPYFIYNDGKVSVQKTMFEIRFSKLWEKFATKRYGTYNPNSRRQQNVRDKYHLYVTSLLEFIYSHGVIEDKDIIEDRANEGLSIYILKGNMAEVSLFSETFDLRSAYEYIVKSIDEYAKAFPDSTNNVEIKFYSELDIYSLIDYNLSYDEERSQKIKEDMISEVYPTMGKVQKGELVVRRGEKITREKHQVLASYKRSYEEQLGDFSQTYIVQAGYLFVVFFSLLVIYLFLYHFRRDVLESFWKTTFILFMITFFVLATFVKEQYLTQISFYVIPFAISPIVIRVFYGSRLALFIHIITVLIVGFMVATPFEHVFMNTIIGIIAIFSLTNLYRRDRLVFAALNVAVTYIIVYIAFSVIQEGDFSNVRWVNIGWFSLNGVLVLLAYPFIFIFEKSFGFLSDTTLMELSDTNQPLLRELAEKAPGTFQHSMQVASLSEDAIRHIGGNPMLVRAGALYHDIGKMNNPLFFIENQSSGINPHDNKSFEESATIIIDHVISGVKMAKKHGLPEQIIDFIRTHHGTSTVHYFYRSYINDNPDEKVDVNKFSYPGPKPFSKETAVLMMADAVEAASRSLTEITEDTINDLVDSIIEMQMKENQFVNADITFKDITTVKDLFKKKLQNIYHARIAYPKEKS